MIEVNKTLSNIFSTTLNNKLRNEKVNDFTIKNHLFLYIKLVNGMIASDIYVFDKMHWYAMKNYRSKHDKKYH